MKLVVIVLLLFFFSAEAEKKNEKKKKIPDEDMYGYMTKYLETHAKNPEAKPMVNKIRNSEEYMKLRAKFGTTNILKEKKK